jgi:RimJ/RimL family protein N-acetyltransferase
MIRTARLVLAPVKPADAAAMFAGLSDRRGYGFIPEEPPESIDWLAGRYARLAKGASPDRRELWLNWTISTPEHAEFMGYVQASVMLDEAAVLIAYHLFPAFWGQGFAREAVAGMLADCRARHGLREARAYIDTRNLRSLRLVEALGFARVAVIPGADYFRGQVSDEYFYRREWA